MSEPIIGIDLGTTFSAAAVFRNGSAEIIPNKNGERITPSSVAFTDKDRLVGKSAVHQSVDNPENTIYAIKRMIGREYGDENVQKLVTNFPFKVVEENDRLTLVVQHKGEEQRLIPEQISAMILEDLKESAEAFLGSKVTKAVITVPAYFNNAQRQSTMDSAEIAGLEVIKLINEPTAAALAYGLNNVGKKIILIYDFGGGTFDVSLLRMNDKDFEVIGIDGDPYLGGEDLDNALVDHFVEQFREEGHDISDNKGQLRQLKSRCEEAKRILSTALEASFTLEGTSLKGIVTRALFEDLNFEHFQKTIKLVQQVLEEAKIAKSEVDDIVLVGGSSRIPKVHELLQEFFDGKRLNKNINPDECVAIGAAIRASHHQTGDSHQTKGLKLIDVNPLSLGFSLHDGSMHVVIPRNSKIPVKQTQMVRPASREQTVAEVKIYEGERYLCKDNHYLGTFELTGIPENGQIEVIFEIDDNSILNVSAIEEATKKSNQIKIDNKGRLTRKEIKRMIGEAQKHSDNDQNERDRIKLMNEYENYLYSVRRTALKSLKNDKITEVTYQSIKTELDKQTKWLSENRNAAKEKFKQNLDCLKTYWESMVQK